jgi:hypothetical protein
MDSAMTDCPWEKIDGFFSLNEYERFLKWIVVQVDAGLAVEVAVQSRYQIFGLEERWFQCVASRELWRLVAPDAPFRGCWEACIHLGR